MSKTQLQNLRGFRDFLPAEKRKRAFVANKIQTVFERFGFAPIETPTLEYAELLLGKYGDEADKLVYSFEDRGERKVALRYDQTVPTARVLTQYQNDLPKYFRRYQIQNVFRADKPQRGRFREFTQCDCDIFGTSSPLADAEILAVYYAVYKELGIESMQIEVNSRKDMIQMFDKMDILASFPLKDKDANPPSSEEWQKKANSLLQSFDKLGKISEEAVVNEIVEKGFKRDEVEEIIKTMKSAAENESVSDELAEIINLAVKLGVPKSVLKFNPSMVRGLDYYTGLIFEGKIPEYTVGSVGGGGRYDNLIGDLSGTSIPAVGFGIGFDRTVDATDQLGLIPTENVGTQILVTIFNEQAIEQSLNVVNQLRQAGIKTELYPAIGDSLGKQFQNAEDKDIPFAIIIGEDEMKAGKVTLKNLKSREQEMMSVEEVIQQISG